MKIKMPKFVGKAGFKLKQHSPEILIAVGVAGAVTSTVLACKSTLKINDILEDDKKDLEVIHEHADEFIADENKPYTEKDKRNDLIGCYGRISIKVVKLYAPAVILGTLSLASIIGSHRILKKRNLALGSAFAITDRAFKEYRSRVKEEIGESKEHDIFLGIKEKTIEEEVTLKNGTTKMRKKKYKGVDERTLSLYTRYFDEMNVNWEPSPDVNMQWLKRVEAAMTDRLRSEGHLFLNDVYYALGFPRIKEGQFVGWIYNPSDPNKDNYVSFNIDPNNNGKVRDFMNGYENIVPLEFNLDGLILDDIFDKKTIEAFGLEA